MTNLNARDLSVLKKILSAHTSRVYLVGGSIRDMLLGQKTQDFDIEIYDILPQDFEILMQNLQAIGVGKSFFVYKWKNFDLSLPRVESKINPTHQGFKISYINDEKIGSSRRDFTINALMMNIFTGKILDFHGGLKDLKSKQIRMIEKQSFQEDSLRVLRGIRFCAKLDFSLEFHTKEAMKNMPLHEISMERIFCELRQIFLSSNPIKGLFLLHGIGVLRFLWNVEIKKNKLKQIASIMKEYYKNVDEKYKEFIFLYVLFGELNMDAKASLKRIKAPKKYFSYICMEYFNNPSDEDLLKVSFKTPLKSWLGVANKSVAQRAKILGIFYEVFPFVKVADIVAEGFKNEAIKEELKKRRLKIIRQICG